MHAPLSQVDGAGEPKSIVKDTWNGNGRAVAPLCIGRTFFRTVCWSPIVAAAGYPRDSMDTAWCSWIRHLPVDHHLRALQHRYSAGWRMGSHLRECAVVSLFGGSEELLVLAIPSAEADPETARIMDPIMEKRLAARWWKRYATRGFRCPWHHGGAICHELRYSRNSHAWPYTDGLVSVLGYESSMTGDLGDLRLYLVAPHSTIRVRFEDFSDWTSSAEATTKRQGRRRVRQAPRPFLPPHPSMTTYLAASSASERIATPDRDGAQLSLRNRPEFVVDVIRSGLLIGNQHGTNFQSIDSKKLFRIRSWKGVEQDDRSGAE